MSARVTAPEPIIPLELIRHACNYSLDHTCVAEGVCQALTASDRGNPNDATFALTLPNRMLKAAGEVFDRMVDHVDPPQERWARSVASDARYIRDALLIPAAEMLTAVAQGFEPLTPEGNLHGPLSPEERRQLGPEGCYLNALGEAIGLASASDDGACALAVANLYAVNNDRQLLDEAVAHLTRVAPGLVEEGAVAADVIPTAVADLRATFEAFIAAGGGDFYNANPRRGLFIRGMGRMSR